MNTSSTSKKGIPLSVISAILLVLHWFLHWNILIIAVDCLYVLALCMGSVVLRIVYAHFPRELAVTDVQRKLPGFSVLSALGETAIFGYLWYYGFYKSALLVLAVFVTGQVFRSMYRSKITAGLLRGLSKDIKSASV